MESTLKRKVNDFILNSSCFLVKNYRNDCFQKWGTAKISRRARKGAGITENLSDPRSSVISV